MLGMCKVIGDNLWRVICDNKENGAYCYLLIDYTVMIPGPQVVASGTYVVCIHTGGDLYSHSFTSCFLLQCVAFVHTRGDIIFLIFYILLCILILHLSCVFTLGETYTACQDSVGVW